MVWIFFGLEKNAELSKSHQERYFLCVLSRLRSWFRFFFFGRKKRENERTERGNLLPTYLYYSCGKGCLCPSFDTLSDEHRLSPPAPFSEQRLDPSSSASFSEQKLDPSSSIRRAPPPPAPLLKSTEHLPVVLTTIGQPDLDRRFLKMGLRPVSVQIRCGRLGPNGPSFFS